MVENWESNATTPELWLINNWFHKSRFSNYYYFFLKKNNILPGFGGKKLQNLRVTIANIWHSNGKRIQETEKPREISKRKPATGDNPSAGSSRSSSRSLCTKKKKGNQINKTLDG